MENGLRRIKITSRKRDYAKIVYFRQKIHRCKKRLMASAITRNRKAVLREVEKLYLLTYGFDRLIKELQNSK